MRRLATLRKQYDLQFTNRQFYDWWFTNSEVIKAWKQYETSNFSYNLKPFISISKKRPFISDLKIVLSKNHFKKMADAHRKACQKIIGEEAINLYLSGWTAIELANKYKVSKGRISTFMWEYGILRTLHKFWNRHEEKSLKKLHSQGLTHLQLAKKFKVSENAIQIKLRVCK
jgi:hypothetical protein